MSNEWREAREAKAGTAPMVVGVLGTIVILGGASALLYNRIDEWWPFYRLPHPDPNLRVLTLSEMGDVLAGISAPLAFLWLFVATWLQRQELSLQRQELKETRGELQRTADENFKQTELMNKTLQASISQKSYKEYALELYYLARDLKKLLSGSHCFLSDDGLRSNFTLFSNYDKNISLEDTGSIDLLFETFHAQSEKFQHIGKIDFSIDDKFYKSIDKLRFSSRKLEEFVMKYSDSRNSLCRARSDALNLTGLLSAIEWAHQELSERTNRQRMSQ